MIIFELTTEMAIPKGFSSTRGIKYWGLIGKKNESLVGKVFKVGKNRVHALPNISYRRPLAATLQNHPFRRIIFS